MESHVKEKSGTFIKVIWEYVKDNIYLPAQCVKITSLTVFLIYVGVPIFVRANQWILPKIVFLNIVAWPPFANLSKPIDFKLHNTRHFQLTVDDGIRLGAWHLLPESYMTSEGVVSLDNFEDKLADGRGVFLYLHGNSGHRGSHHRVLLYQLLASLGHHVIAVDYRGYGDSTGVPTETGVVNDALNTYRWVKERVRASTPIYLWGHSLGTGIATKVAKKLCDEGDAPAGVVLESPFNNIQEAAFNHPFATPYRFLPFFNWIFIDGLGEHGIYFNSEENIQSVSAPVLIMHAKDDYVVPFQLGEKLYNKAKSTRSACFGDIEFVSFEGHHRYGHKYICQDPHLPQIITNFIESASSAKS